MNARIGIVIGIIAIVAAAIGSSAAFALSTGEAPRSQAQPHAQVGTVPPFPISFQGVLTNTNGQAVPDGGHQAIFSIYPDPTTTQALWHNCSVRSPSFPQRETDL